MFSVHVWGISGRKPMASISPPYAGITGLLDRLSEVSDEIAVPQ